MKQISSTLGEASLVDLVARAAACPAGPFVEVGVWRGGSAARLHALAVEQGRALHLFDTFCGIPHACDLDKHVVGDFADTSIALVRSLCPQAEIWPGIFPDTLPSGLSNIAFAHIDVDQFESVLDATQTLFPRMVAGGVLWYDDWPHLSGARAAILECFPMHKLHLTPSGHVFVIKGAA